jgi:CheY-like chemotaxis protein
MPIIVIAEDDDALRAVWQRTLSKSGYDVRAVANGRIALEVMEHLRPDLVITDLSMPEVSGSQLIHAMQQRPALANVPVLIISGWAHTAEPLGYPILAKPFSLQELLAVVQRLLEG